MNDLKPKAVAKDMLTPVDDGARWTFEAIKLVAESYLKAESRITELEVVEALHKVAVQQRDREIKRATKAESRITELEDKLLHSDRKEIEAVYRKNEELEAENQRIREERLAFATHAAELEGKLKDRHKRMDKLQDAAAESLIAVKDTKYAKGLRERITELEGMIADVKRIASYPPVDKEILNTLKRSEENENT